MPLKGFRGQPLYGQWMVSSLNHDPRMEPARENLVPIGGLELPQHLFHCRLDDQPDHLVPERYLRNQGWDGLSGRPLFINPDCKFARRGELPSTVADSARLLANFALDEDMVWIEDRVRNARLPFWLGPKFSALLSGSQPGDRAPSTLSYAACSFLTMAQVLVPDNHLVNRNTKWKEVVCRCASEFETKRYTPIAQLIHPFHISALRRYYRHLIRQGKFKLGDDQSPRRYTAQNEATARFFHHQLTAAVSRIVEEPVKPSYVYLGSYQGGAELESHIDREQCEFSISLCIDYSPEPACETPWPLQLHTSSGKTTVYQGIGDGLLYCGRELPHSRDPLPMGNTSTSLFFHYVRENFAGQLT
jgi:hypothetical protein